VAVRKNKQDTIGAQKRYTTSCTLVRARARVCVYSCVSLLGIGNTEVDKVPVNLNLGLSQQFERLHDNTMVS